MKIRIVIQPAPFSWLLFFHFDFVKGNVTSRDWHLHVEKRFTVNVSKGPDRKKRGECVRL